MAELLLWWNLVYVLAFFFALLYAVLNAVGLASSSQDVDVGGDVDVETIDHDVSVDHLGLLDEALSFFGIGKVPLSFIMMSFLLTFSVVGWIANQVLIGTLKTPALFFPVSLAAAVFCAVGATKVMASSIGKYMKPVETSAVRRSALEGRIATARLPITSEFGMALVRDQHETLHKVVCKVDEGSETIPKGQTLLLIRFMPVKKPGKRPGGYYIVEPYDVSID